MNIDVEQMRRRYKPASINILFIGESPPSNGTFFYLANSNLYTCVHNAFLQTYGPKCEEGTNFLSFFKSCGCYLDDLCHEPVNRLVDNERVQVRLNNILLLSQRVNEMKPRSVIIVMKRIENEVKAALKLSGFISPYIFKTPFPVHSENNRKACVEEIAEKLATLIKAGILPQNC